MPIADFFLKIDGIEGESQDAKHKGDIEIESFSWGANQTGSFGYGGGGGAGKVAMQDFHFVMKVNKASPKLFLACATGEHIKRAVLVTRKAGKEQQEFLKVTSEDILVSSYTTGGSDGADTIPLDQISLNFAKMTLEYREQKLDGTLGGVVKAGYDVKANKLI